MVHQGYGHNNYECNVGLSIFVILVSGMLALISDTGMFKINLKVIWSA